jgi:hypothetical protein
MRPRFDPLIGALVVALTACASEGGRESSTLRATRDTVGDTIIVRTSSGSAWGDAQLVEEVRIGRLDGPDEYTFGRIGAIATGLDGTLYVLDEQAPHLRAYSPDGTYLREIGHEGEGPGELKQPDSGLAVLADGRILVRDPANARITLFGPDGEYETEWRIRGSRFTSTPLYVDRAGDVYVFVFDFVEDGARFSFARYGPDGQPRDTIPYPTAERSAPRLTAEFTSGDSQRRSTTSVPFWPVQVETLSLDGEFVIGDPESYSIDVPRETGVLRIQRHVEPVPVSSGERANQRERITHDMRQVEPGWDWDGPVIPDTKPAFRSLRVDDDGRLWVHLHTQAERIPDEEIDRPDPGSNDPPPLEWREPTRFDVFGADGTYLGQLEAPGGFATSPRPAIKGERIWAVVHDELDIPYVVRFRIVPQKE